MDKSKVVVMLDNGHAQSTPGKRSPILSKDLQNKYGTDRLYEYRWNRDVVKMLSEQLQKRGIETWIVTPEEKKDVVLSTRASRVNNKYSQLKSQGKTGFLISVHVNAGPSEGWGKYKGWSVWTTVGKTKSDDLAECLWQAASEIAPKYGKKTRQDMSDGDHDYESNFTVIYKPVCVAVLTENFFMNDEEECEFLLSDEGKQACVDIHIKGIEKYIEECL